MDTFDITFIEWCGYHILTRGLLELGAVAGQRLLLHPILLSYIYYKVGTAQVINKVKIEQRRRYGRLVRHIFAQLRIKHCFLHQLAAGDMVRMTVFPVGCKHNGRGKFADFRSHRSQMLFCHVQAPVR
ncbi:hypothetical protein D3C75_1079090 [compost metagenome]